MFCLPQGEWAFTSFRAGQHLKLLLLWESPTMHVTRQPYCHPCGLTLPDVILPQGRALVLAWKIRCTCLRLWLKQGRASKVQEQLELTKAASVSRSGGGRDSHGGPCPAFVGAVLRHFLLMVWGWDSDHPVLLGSRHPTYFVSYQIPLDYMYFCPK